MRRFSRPATAAAALALALALAGCGSAAASQSPGAGPAPSPGSAQGPGPDSIAAELEARTLPPGPRQAQFGWELDEAGARFRGRGVARYQAPDRFRLDLFGPRGETYLAAALVDETPRVPAAVAQRFKLPPPALLWASVGVVRPPGEAQLQSAAADGEQAVVRYSIGEQGVLEYRARGWRLVSVRRLQDGGVRESVELERAADGTLRRAQYRDWVQFRTLNLSLEASTDVAAFPDDVWSPPGTDR